MNIKCRPFYFPLTYVGTTFVIIIIIIMRISICIMFAYVGKHAYMFQNFEMGQTVMLIKAI